MKSITNMNTLNALIRDEDMASKEYYQLSKAKDTPDYMRKILHKMSRDEHNHKHNLFIFRERLRMEKFKK